MRYDMTSPNVQFESLQGSSPIPAQQYLPIVFRLHQELPYHVVAEQVGITWAFRWNKHWKVSHWWIQWLENAAGASPAPAAEMKETCSSHSMNTLSAASASLHKAYTHTHTDFFISSSFRAHACAPLGGLSQRFRKMCSSIWGEIIQGVSSRNTTIICIGKIGMNVSVSVPSFCCNDSPLHVRTFSVAYGDDKKKGRSNLWLSL